MNAPTLSWTGASQFGKAPLREWMRVIQCESIGYFLRVGNVYKKL